MNFNSEDYVELYDYSVLSVDYEYTQITYEDIEKIIETEMSINEAYVEIKERKKAEIDDILLISVNGTEEYYFAGSNAYSEEFDNILLSMETGESKTVDNDILGTVNLCLHGIYKTATMADMEFILNYYNRSSFEELETFIRDRAEEEIIFNYAFDMICKNSVVIGFPQEMQKQIDVDIKNGKEKVLQQYTNFDVFLEDSGMTIDEFEDNIASYYFDIMIYKAILDKNNIELTQDDISEYRKNHLTDEYTDYDAFKELAYIKVRDILVETKVVYKE